MPMLALWIIGGILLVLILLLNCPVRAEIKYLDSVFSIKVKYLFLTLFPLKQKEKPSRIRKQRKQKNRSDSDKNKASPSSEHSAVSDSAGSSPAQQEQVDSLPEPNEKDEPHSEVKSLRNSFDEIIEKIQFFKNLLETSKKGIRRLIKGIVIADIELDFIAADEDAYKAALFYGGLNMLVFNVISFLRIFFTLSIRKINITCGYNSSDSRYDGQCNIRMRPATVLLAGISILSRYLVNTYKINKQNKKTKGMVSDGTSDSRPYEHSYGKNS